MSRVFQHNRAPFGLFYHAAWFTQPHHKEGFISFLDTIVAMDDVWVVTNWQAIQWIRNPTPLALMHNFEPFSCNFAVSQLKRINREINVITMIFFLFRIDRRNVIIRRFAIFGTKVVLGTWRPVKLVQISIHGRAKLVLGAVASITKSILTNEPTNQSTWRPRPTNEDKRAKTRRTIHSSYSIRVLLSLVPLKKHFEYANLFYFFLIFSILSLLFFSILFFSFFFS